MSQRAFQYVDALPRSRLRGRGAGLNPANRFETVRLHVLGEYLDQTDTRTIRCAHHAASGGSDRWQSAIDNGQQATTVLPDHARTVINYVDPRKSPDLGFNWTINPYRGCEHGCIYCYARPTHETLGLSCGLDFETRIFAKFDAPNLLRRELASPRWEAQTIVMSGVTDCYQPIERKLRITRGCLEVLAQCRQPVGLVTKSRLILRDLDLLQELAAYSAVHVAVSITTLESSLAATMEPRASSPADRLHTIAQLAHAGIPTAVMVAPIIPGLTDTQVPRILQAAADSGARSAGYVLLRLPHQVKTLFVDWLQRHFPQRASHVESLVRQTRGGQLYDATFGIRQRGQGPVAEQIHQMFKLFTRRLGLDRSLAPLSNSAFVRPSVDGQLSLFARVD